jgi:hypothetical protein
MTNIKLNKEQREAVRELCKLFAFKWMNSYIDSLESQEVKTELRPPVVTKEDINTLEEKLGMNDE